VLELTRKAATLDELTAQESQEFGLILSKVSAAVRKATKCERAYRLGRILRQIPISIGSDAWIAAAAFVGPRVYIGNGVVLGARAAVFRDLPDLTVCVGVPAKPYRARLKPKNAG